MPACAACRWQEGRLYDVLKPLACPLDASWPEAFWSGQSAGAAASGASVTALRAFAIVHGEISSYGTDTARAEVVSQGRTLRPMEVTAAIATAIATATATATAVGAHAHAHAHTVPPCPLRARASPPEPPPSTRRARRWRASSCGAT